MVSIRKRNKPQKQTHSHTAKKVRILLVDCLKFTTLKGFVVKISSLNEECEVIKEKRKNRWNDDDEVITIDDDDDVIVIEDEVNKSVRNENTDSVDGDDNIIKVSDEDDDDDDDSSFDRDDITEMEVLEDNTRRGSNDETELIIPDIRTVKNWEINSDEGDSSKQNKEEESKTVFRHKKLDLRRRVGVEVLKDGEEKEETGITVNIYV